MKKIFKVFFSSIAALIPIGFIIGFATAWNAPQSVNAAGSSSVEPLMTIFGNNYTDADIVVQSGGSGEGIKDAANLSKDLGNASKNPYQTVEDATVSKNGYDKQMWIDHDTKTVTIAWDAIAIVYKPSNQSDPVLDINGENISLLYDAFAGVVNPETNKLVTYGDLLKDGDTTTLHPYARTGGANASGTATSFLTQSGFDNYLLNWNESNSVYEKLYNGDYVSGNVTTTSESNVDSWNMFSSENRLGAIIYLSLGFVSINRSIIEGDGYKIATYEGVQATTSNVKNHSYGWYSPLNTILSLKYANDSTKNFVWWIVTSQQAEDLIEKNGFIPLNDDQKIYMTYDADENGVIQQSWPSENAGSDKNLEKQFFSMSDYSLTYNISKQYFGVPKT